MEAALSLGSNLGNRRRHLLCAREALRTLQGFRLVQVSPLYETDPVGVRPEFSNLPFLNAVLIGWSALPPETLAAQVHAIETRLGRVRASTDRYAPRVIDIDLLYHGDCIIATPSLRLPHPQCLLRRFVCGPLADMRPDCVLPGQTRTVREALDHLPSEPGIRPYAPHWTPDPAAVMDGNGPDGNSSESCA